MGLRNFLAESDMYADIDPTTLRLGDSDDFPTGSFDHSLDDIDSRPVLHATHDHITKPGVHEEVVALAGKVAQLLR